MPVATKLIPNGDSALDIHFDSPQSEALSRVIISLAREIAARQFKGITDIIPAYQSLTLIFDPQLTDNIRLGEQLTPLTLAVKPQPDSTDKRKILEVPVCYEVEFAPDLSVLTRHTGLSPAQIIERHTRPLYLIHMLGFSPGFCYLGGLDPSLHCPRKSSPSVQVPAGAVGIGGKQTGIYPQPTPGGWQIIGRTPLRLFAPEKDQPFLARPLQRVRFIAISHADFIRLDAVDKPTETMSSKWQK